MTNMSCVHECACVPIQVLHEYFSTIDTHTHTEGTYKQQKKIKCLHANMYGNLSLLSLSLSVYICVCMCVCKYRKYLVEAIVRTSCPQYTREHIYIYIYVYIYIYIYRKYLEEAKVRTSCPQYTREQVSGHAISLVHGTATCHVSISVYIFDVWTQDEVTSCHYLGGLDTCTYCGY